MLLVQGKSKGGWRGFSPAGKNENVIAKMQYPLPSLLQVLSSQHEMSCFILLGWGQNRTQQCSHVGQPWKAKTCGLVKGKLGVPPCTHLVQSGAQAPQNQCGSGTCPSGGGWPCEVTAARRQRWSPGCPPVLFPRQGRSRLQAAGRRMGRDKKEEPPDQRPQLMAVPRARAPAASGPETPSGGPARASYARRNAASEHV